MEETIVKAPAAPTSRNTLFSAVDLKAWSAKVASGSEWGMAARRLRTVFMRLLANGYIGEKTLELDVVLIGLPEIHRSDIQRLIPLLAESELLIVQQPSTDTTTTVAINPKGLQHIQSLVNRELSQIWRPLVLDESVGLVSE